MVYFDGMDGNDVQKFDWGEMEWVHESGQDGTGKLSAGIVRLHPGGHQEKHFHMSEEQIIYVVKGRGIHITDGRKKSIAESMVLYCQPYSEHEVINTGDEDLVMLIVYAPLYGSETKELEASAVDVGSWPLDEGVAASVCDKLKETLRLNTAVFDSDGNAISYALSEGSFCLRCVYVKECKGCERHAADVTRACVRACCLNVVSVEKPVIYDGKVVGSIGCGGFITSYPKDWREIIAGIAFDTGEEIVELERSYMALPYVPKSRLYAVEESVQAAASFLKSEAERSAYEQELIVRDTQIMKNYEEKVRLENALRSANRLLRESRFKIDAKVPDCSVDEGKGVDSLISRVNDYIYENCTETLTLGIIAEKFYLSPNYLSSRFNSVNKMPFNDYINEVRLMRAKRYLVTTDMHVKEIGKVVGFNSNSYFSEVFKKIVGMTPREYRLRFTKKRSRAQ